MIRSDVESAIQAAHIWLNASQATDWSSLDPEAHDAPTWDKISSTEAARPLQMMCPSLEPEARDAPTWDKLSSAEVARLLQMKCPSCFGGQITRHSFEE